MAGLLSLATTWPLPGVGSAVYTAVSSHEQLNLHPKPTDNTGGQSVVSWAPGRTDVFVRGTDSAAYHKWQTAGAGSNWFPNQNDFERFPGQVSDDVTSVSWAANRIDLFARGLDGACWHRWWNGSAWAGWENLGGDIVGAVSAVAWAENRLDLFARGSDNTLAHKWWDGQRWSVWETLGGGISGNPAAVSWGAGRLDVFVRGSDNVVRHKYWNGSRWLPSQSGWELMGGSVLEDVTALAPASNRLELFIRGSNSAVWQKSWNGAAWVPARTGWTSLGGVAVSRPAAAAAWGSGSNRTTLAVQGTDNAVYVKENYGRGWSDWNSIGGVVQNAPTIHPRGGDGAGIFARGTDGALYVYE